MESSQEQSKKNMDNMNEDLKKRMARYGNA
jgi:hypothetical protein